MRHRHSEREWNTMREGARIIKQDNTAPHIIKQNKYGPKKKTYKISHLREDDRSPSNREIFKHVMENQFQLDDFAK